MLTKVLTSLGFSSDETALYIRLLDAGRSSIGTLAKKTKRPRASLYGIMDRLCEKGIVVQSIENGVKVFYPESPSRINQLFRSRLEDLEHHQSLFGAMLPQIEEKLKLKSLIPKVQVFEGQKGLQSAIREGFLYRDIISESFWPIKSMIEVLSPDFFRYMNKERINNNIYVQALWPQDQVVDISLYPFLGAGKEFLREIRVAPEGIEFTTGYWLFKNRAIILSSMNECFAVSIESYELTQMLRSQFAFIWNLSKQLQIPPNHGASFLKELAQT